MVETATPKGKGGRPKGLGRVAGSGRKKGTPNKDRAATVERILKLADPIGFLCAVCKGDRMVAAPEPGGEKRSFWYPTGDQRIQAGMALARKVMPDTKAVEIAGPLGEPLSVRINLGP